MTLNAFTRELGTRQGRIAPVGASPVAGNYVFCLGLDGKRTEILQPGDFVQVAQQSTFEPGTKVIHIHATIVPPHAMPSGYRWRVSLLVDDVVIAGQIIDRPRTRRFSANVSKMSSGEHVVAVRLSLEAA